MKIPKDYNERIMFVKRLVKTPSDYEAIKPSHTLEDVKRNIENFIGDMKIPLGIAGPIEIKGKFASGEFYVPMATAEGTLLASYSRGMKIINECGGCETLVFDDYFLRAAIFVTSSLQNASKLRDWCVEHNDEIKKAVNSSDKFIKLLEIDYDFIGTNLIVSFTLDTGDAMGSNMGSKAAGCAASYIQENSKLSKINYPPFPEDKKIIPSRQKGKKVVASVRIKNEVLSRIARVDNNKLFEFFNLYKNALARYGGCSLNIHSVNGMAALFLAFGQDPAYLGECSQVIVDAKPINDEILEFSVTIPSLIIGSVGGGTGLPSPKTALGIIDCYGAGKAKKLAEIMAATILAGEINCGAAQCALEFVKAHEAMGKNPPKEAQSGLCDR